MTSKKHRKSLTMSDKLFNDMNYLCDSLGINSHSYILNLIAREVHKDMVGYNFKTRPSGGVAENHQIEEEYLSDNMISKKSAD
jgi:hypothetical protein